MIRRGLLLFAALVVSACTQEAAVTPSTTADGASTTTTEPVADATIDVVVDTTVAPETSPTPETTTFETTTAETTTTGPATTDAPTTTVPADGDPTTVSTEYFLGGDPDAWLYLGRWTGNAWESDRDDDQQLREPSAATANSVLIHELDVDPVEGTIDGSGEACATDGRTGPVITPNGRAPENPGFGYRSIAYPADWSTQPRPVALVDASIDSYVAAGQAAFTDLDIDASAGTIQQLVVADLDGDGDTEALVAFGADGFSALLLIDADSGASITVARSVTTTVTPTTVTPTTVTSDTAAPSTVAEGDEPGEPTTTPADTFRTLAVADLNGDGRFEIVAHAFEGSSAEVSVSTYDGTEVTAVLTAGC